MSRNRKRRGIRLRGGAPAELQLSNRAACGDIPKLLPLIHVTAVGTAKEIIGSTKLETRTCSVFGKKLVYFFSVKPAYRLGDSDEKSHQINRFPFVFVVRPESIADPFHVYPFDTGGAFSGVFDDQADPHLFLEEYALKSHHSAVAGQIGWAFGSIESYFEGNIRHDILENVPRFDTVTRGYVDIAQMARTGNNQPDKRASAIEIASVHDIPLKDNVTLAIIPKQYLEDDDGHGNVDFLDRLNKLNIPWTTYNWQPNTSPNAFQGEIADLVRLHLQEGGYLT
ncbi:MAG: hypothetical protein JWR10_2609 [Rubritepida sp.]|nr:hypothetical protein [Rubritepida sp.]